MIDLKQLYRFKIILLVVVLTSGGCSSSKYSIKQGQSIEEIYNSAKSLYDSGRYKKASIVLEKLILYARGTSYVQDAQFLLADSKYRRKLYIEAAFEFQRYARRYPQANNVEEAEFKRIICFYHLSPRYELFQDFTKQALDAVELFFARHPNSSYTAELEGYRIQMRNKLAKKLYHAGKQYQRLRYYKASIVYYDYILSRYPESKYAEKGLFESIETYIGYAKASVKKAQEERHKEAINRCYKYNQLFPMGPNINKVKKIIENYKPKVNNI